MLILIIILVFHILEEIGVKLSANHKLWLAKVNLYIFQNLLNLKFNIFIILQVYKKAKKQQNIQKQKVKVIFYYILIYVLEFIFYLIINSFYVTEKQCEKRVMIHISNEKNLQKSAILFGTKSNAYLQINRPIFAYSWLFLPIFAYLRICSKSSRIYFAFRTKYPCLFLPIFHHLTCVMNIER